MARPLQPYIAKTSFAGDISVSRQFQHYPKLLPNTVNRILFYPGSFNPPHLGHYTLLHHVFTNAPADLNLIAAFIWPLSDDSVAAKNTDRGQEDDLVLTRKQRVQLWLGHGLPAYIFVCEPSIASFRSSYAEWEALRNRLAEEVGRDGLTLEFCCLLGPDCIEKLGGQCHRS
ncbi:hypothetical protein BDW74DRAFT_183688 [Aspergillus multicolor]|uniref:uncharacterized protein n=1 Tax=Aspergillus multicolor TaxID=41759 RepID=UPI003CCE1A2F